MSIVTERTKVAAKVTARLTGTLGSTIDEIWALREDKRKAEIVVKDIEAKIAGKEEALLGRMDKEDTRKAEGKHASVAITEATVGTIEDWDAFTTYLAKSKNFHLIQKRISDPAYRELLGMGKPVPGVKPFTKRKLTVRSLSV